MVRLPDVGFAQGARAAWGCQHTNSAFATYDPNEGFARAIL
ncbi:MAG: hypothetical protein ABJX32_21125 [Tateyamaria sp.]|jgi:hypothetical protein